MPPMNTLREPGAAHCKQNSRQPKHREPHSVRLLNPRAAFASQAGHHAKINSAGSQQPQVGCGGAPARWAPPTLNCAMVNTLQQPWQCHCWARPAWVHWENKREKRSLFAAALSALRLGLCSLEVRGWQLGRAPVLLPSTPLCLKNSHWGAAAREQLPAGQRRWEQGLPTASSWLRHSCSGILRALAGPGTTQPGLGTACVRGGRLKAKWCRIMGPSVSAGARDNSKKETHYFPFLSGFGWEPT